MLTRTILCTLMLMLMSCIAHAEPFSYQGRLELNGEPANGNYDMRFELFGSTGITTGLTSTASSVLVEDGLFSVDVDFVDDEAFANDIGQTIQISVREAGSGGAYTDLSPRSKLNSVPVAEHVLNQEIERFGTQLYVGDETEKLMLNGGVHSGNFVNAVTMMQVNFTHGGLGGMYINGAHASAFPFYAFAIQNAYRAYIGLNPNGTHDEMEFWLDNTNALTLSEEIARVGTDLSVNGEIFATYNGSQRQISPVAFGTVTDNGQVVSGSGNFSVTWNSSINRYEISIDDVSYHLASYTTVVTPQGVTPFMPSSSSLAGDLLIFMHNLSGTRTQGSFGFVVYRN